MYWRIWRAWLKAMWRGLCRGEVLGRWFLLSREPVPGWLPFGRCLDRFCPMSSVYLIHVWAWSLGKGKEISTWLEYREDVPMRIQQTYQREATHCMITMPAPKLHIERPWAVMRFKGSFEEEKHPAFEGGGDG
jgi:hypothetical protein